MIGDRGPSTPQANVSGGPADGTARQSERAAAFDVSLPSPAPAQRFSGYPLYRRTEHHWLDTIPTHWRMRRLKFVSSLKFSGVNKKTEEGEDAVRLCNYVDVYKRDYITSEIDFMVASATREEIQRFSLVRGDVLVTKDSEEWNDIAVPALVDQELPGVLCGYHLAQVRPDAREMVGEYLARAFAAHPICDQFRVAANGITRFGLSVDSIASAWFPVPPVEEQHAIGQFLRRETARIDSLVAKKRRLIELLREKRTALISQAVTKGLNPAAKLKPSGIDWLGDVPTHWQIKQLKYAVTFQRGHDLPQESRASGEVPLVTSAGVDAWIDQIAAKAPGIVTGRYGTVGEFYLIEQDYWPLNTTLYSINLRGNQPRFLWYMLQTLKDVFLVNAGKSAVPGVDRNDLHPIAVAVPPLDEQAAIVGHLDNACNAMDRLTRSVEAIIGQLHECRSALISAAVTGKIDVRGEVG